MATPTAAVGSPNRPKNLAGRLLGGDEIAYGITWFFAASILAITVLLVYELDSQFAGSGKFRVPLPDFENVESGYR